MRYLFLPVLVVLATMLVAADCGNEAVPEKTPTIEKSALSEYLDKALPILDAELDNGNALSEEMTSQTDSLTTLGHADAAGLRHLREEAQGLLADMQALVPPEEAQKLHGHWVTACEEIVAAYDDSIRGVDELDIDALNAAIEHHDKAGVEFALAGDAAEALK